jgi:hypothetical protein
MNISLIFFNLFFPIFRGPVNSTTHQQQHTANSYMFVNTNSYMGAVNHLSTSQDSTNAVSEMEKVQSQEASEANNLQRAVVGAWLLVKESTALLTKLVYLSPTSNQAVLDINDPHMQEKMVISDSADVSGDTFLTGKDVVIIGNTLIDALGRLKHMGAIAEAHNALQVLCEVLLK